MSTIELIEKAIDTFRRTDKLCQRLGIGILDGEISIAREIREPLIAEIIQVGKECSAMAGNDERANQ